jgi:hypothetical protein
MGYHSTGDDVAIIYIPRFREFGISILDGGTSFQAITFCPWCGTELPKSLRTEWFSRVEEMGMDPYDPALPQSMTTDAWWKST